MSSTRGYLPRPLLGGRYSGPSRSGDARLREAEVREWHLSKKKGLYSVDLAVD